MMFVAFFFTRLQLNDYLYRQIMGEFFLSALVSVRYAVVNDI